MKLQWHSAGTDEPRDQNADTALVEHGYWSLGPASDGAWSVELVEQNDDLTVIGHPVSLHRATEAEAKLAAETHEEARP
jgi:hypothetical protein